MILLLIFAYSFADELYKECNYHKACIEYMRMDFYEPNSYYKYRIGMCYLKKGDLIKASEYFLEAMNYDSAKIALIKVYIKLKKFELAYHTAKDIGEYYAGVVAIHTGKYDEAIAIFDSIGKDALKQVAIELKKMKLKSPIKARLLSAFIPGLGEIYTGHVWFGLYSFVMTSALGYLLYDRISAHKYYDAAIVFNLFSRFYQGSIYHAVRFAKKYNKRKRTGTRISAKNIKGPMYITFGCRSSVFSRRKMVEEIFT